MHDCPPVLLIVFNRPHLARQVFEAIRRHQPARLYIAADGPRDPTSHPEDRPLCEETRRIAKSVDWPCQVFTRFSDHNQGCGRGESNAISWFFENEESGVILEDDCLPSESFFPYCAHLLEHYKDRPEVMHICGNNFAATMTTDASSGPSYGFGKYAQVWGWASWARAWRHYQFDVGPSVDDSNHFRIRGIDMFRRFAHQERVRSTLPPRRVDTWDYQWQFAVLKNGGLCVCPSVNLISNLGFGSGSAHTTNPNARAANAQLGRLSFPLSHPPKAIDCPEINRIYAKHMLGDPKRYRKKLYKYWLRRIIRRQPSC